MWNWPSAYATLASHCTANKRPTLAIKKTFIGQTLYRAFSQYQTSHQNECIDFSFLFALLCSRESEWALPVIAQVLRFIICIIIIMSPILVFPAILFKIIKNFFWRLSLKYIQFKVGHNQKRLICLSYPQTDKPNYLPWSWIFDSVQYQRAALSKRQFINLDCLFEDMTITSASSDYFLPLFLFLINFFYYGWKL